VWVIGGAQVYAEALGLADQLVITHLDSAIEGDTFAPPIGDQWRVVDRQPANGWHESSAGLRFRVITYAR
jgi:dihydrofolate reductase